VKGKRVVRRGQKGVERRWLGGGGGDFDAQGSAGDRREVAQVLTAEGRRKEAVGSGEGGTGTGGALKKKKGKGEEKGQKEKQSEPLMQEKDLMCLFEGRKAPSQFHEKAKEEKGG